MAKAERSGGIEIEQDMKFQQRSWKVQRAGWIVMVLAAIAALLGIFGNGPLSSASAGEAGDIRVEYQRFVRLDSPEMIAIDIGRTVNGDSTISVWLDREWMRNHNVKGIVPEPRESRVAGDRVIYQFEVDPVMKPARIEFELETRGYGKLRGRAGIIGGSQVSFSQLSYF